MPPAGAWLRLALLWLWAAAATADLCARHRVVGAVTFVDTGGPATVAVLLHGARFSHAEWCRIGTIQALHNHAFRVIALDLPGYGQSQGPPWESHTQLLDWLRRRGVGRAIYVAPSMAGALALPLVVAEPAAVLGFVGVAPVGLRVAEGKCAVPCLFVYGEADPLLARSRALAEKFSGRDVAVLPAAKHACYLDDPDRWHALLLPFVQLVRFEGPAAARRDA